MPAAVQYPDASTTDTHDWPRWSPFLQSDTSRTSLSCCFVAAALERKQVACGVSQALQLCFRYAVSRAAARTVDQVLVVTAAVRCCARDPGDARARREREVYCPVHPICVYFLRRRRACACCDCSGGRRRDIMRHSMTQQHMPSCDDMTHECDIMRHVVRFDSRQTRVRNSSL